MHYLLFYAESASKSALPHIYVEEASRTLDLACCYVFTPSC